MNKKWSNPNLLEQRQFKLLIGVEVKLFGEGMRFHLKLLLLLTYSAL